MRLLKRLFGREPSQAVLRCSFCARREDQVKRLVAGPSVYICDECIKTCVAVLDEHDELLP